MSLFMGYILFWMMFIHKQECAVIRYHHNRNAIEYVIQKYMNPLRRLSADLPNHAIEMEIEIQRSDPREVTNDQRRFIRLINPRLPKPISRAQDRPDGEDAPPVPDATATSAVVPDAGQATAAPAAPSDAPAPASPPDATAPAVVAVAERSDTQKIPVYMEDLKKALDELEKKLITNSENSTSAAGGLQDLNTPVAAPQILSQPVRSVDDIVQLLKKATYVEHRMPKAGDEKLEWMQIKIPKSIQL